MSPAKAFALTALAMLAFAGNSLLCRLALKHTAIDPASFTAIRIISGALTLWLVVRSRSSTATHLGNWPSASALFVYAVAFSFSYVTLTAGTGALLLFGAVQATMIGYGVWRGERPGGLQLIGLVAAGAGLAALLLPGLAAPPIRGALLMIAAGIAWGVYSLRGKGGGDATAVTAGNFQRAALLAAGLGAAMLPWAAYDPAGLGYAVCSGALASGLGYAIWYTALRGLSAIKAASVQLCVPAIAAAGGVALLGEPLTQRLLVCSIAILGGIAMVIFGKRRVIA
jgi:drug/metabolite transporter (DMT)-like permease